MGAPLILAIDQGTSSTKCLLVDASGQVVATGSAPLGEYHPQPGWVEQDAGEIWASVTKAVAVTVTPALAPDVVAVGLHTQRESCVIWDTATGEPLTKVLSWQDQRTAALCESLAGQGELVRARSGLPLDPMFSAAKAKFLLDRIDPERTRARSGTLRIGTIDAFLLSRFSSDPLIEVGNASRTQLMDVRRACWDDELLDLFDVPLAALPEIRASIGPFPGVKGLTPLRDGTPLQAVMADSHAALFGHGAFTPGAVKATHGTGSSVMGLIAGAEHLDPGLCLTIAWGLVGERTALAVEGNIRACGSTLRWVTETLGLTTQALVDLAHDQDAGGVYLVPGFNGLGAPWWDARAEGLLTGIKLDTTRAQIARAALDSIAHQVADVVAAVVRGGTAVTSLHVDGGPTRNDALMQDEADMIGVPVLRAHTAEVSALGVAHLAGLGAGLWSWEQLQELPRGRDVFSPRLPAGERYTRREGWRRAVVRALSESAT